MNKDRFDVKEYYRKMQPLVLDPSKSDYIQFLLNDTENFVRIVLGGMTKTQMRNIFELMKGSSTREELNMLKPKLLYTAGRLSGQSKFFLLELSRIAVNVKTEVEVQNFIKYIETVLAYHKYHAKN